MLCAVPSAAVAPAAVRLPILPILLLLLLPLLLLTHHQDLLWLNCLAADGEACTAIGGAPDSLLGRVF
jgi:hypothetical protein